MHYNFYRRKKRNYNNNNNNATKFVLLWVFLNNSVAKIKNALLPFYYSLRLHFVDKLSHYKNYDLFAFLKYGPQFCQKRKQIFISTAKLQFFPTNFLLFNISENI